MQELQAALSLNKSQLAGILRVAVAKSHNRSPRNVRMRGPHVSGDMRRCFTDQLEVTQYRIVSERVGNERVLVHILR